MLGSPEPDPPFGIEPKRPDPDPFNLLPDRSGPRWRRVWGWPVKLGVRRGEWWIGARENLFCDGIEWNLFGLTAIVGRRNT